MSYDLHVYTPGALDGAVLRELVVGTTSLDVGEFDQTRGWYAVVRGAKRRYCFTIDGPVRMEAEDVPDEVTAVLLGATHIFYVSVEGSSSVDIPHAIRFARRLAGTLGGVVVDQQTDETWAKGAGRQVMKPSREKRVSVVGLSWYCRSDSVPDDLGARYIALCRRSLPEALLRRFGEYEPFQGKLAIAGDEGFARAWVEATSTLFFAASPPCIGGSLWAGPGERHPRRIWHMSLNMHHQPLADDARWRDAAQRLFVTIADQLPAFYAYAEVTRNHLWTGRSLWIDGYGEWAISPERREGWTGLLPYPTWLAWYGDPYRSLIEGQLSGGTVTVHNSGLLHELAEGPADRDQLTGALTRRQGLRRVTRWAPPELLSKVRPNPERIQPVPLDPAELIPAELRED